MIKKLILAVLAIIVIAVAGLVIAIAMQPDEYVVERSAAINAPSEAVFERVNDFHKWDAWSPWAKLDPEMKVTYSGPPAGVGASYSWVGNDQVGEGKMTILESHPAKHVKIDLEFIKPFQSRSLTDFTFVGDGAKTNVTWKMKGQHNVISKAMCLFVTMDSMIGPDFEKGLANLSSSTASITP